MLANLQKKLGTVRNFVVFMERFATKKKIICWLLATTFQQTFHHLDTRIFLISCMQQDQNLKYI